MKMNKDEFLFLMYFEHGIVPNLVERYIKDTKNYDKINREELAIKIGADN